MSKSRPSFLGCLLSYAIIAATTAVAAPAGAQVFQTDAAMTPLPQPVGMAEYNLVTGSWGHAAATTSYKDPYTGLQLNGTTWTDTMNGNRMLAIPLAYGKYYAPPAYPQFVDGDAITLQGLFKWRGEMIDWRKDAKTAPGYFSPACGFTGQLLLLGGNCKVSFGWYNVDDPNSTTKPAANEIYEFIPSDPTYLNCKDENGGAKTDGFCPLAWDNRSPRDLSVRQWTPKAFDSGNIKTDPRYKGKYVGFAVIGNPATSCTENKYSMLAYNQKNSQGKPWVTSLIYQSTVDPEGFYMAFEDLPMSTADWHQTGVAGSNATNDGDFNDFVFYISGISCAGGNQPCDTGLKGACSVGHTDCAGPGETPMCRPVVQPGVEICDNVDNDCNGIVDDGDAICPDSAKPVCFQGQCVASCSKGEFPCPAGLACDTNGHCVDPSCSGVDCPMGQACRSGKCVDPCGGVVCPYGSQCELGQCVDPCNGVTCPAGRVCDKGLCVATCDCRGCADGLTCASDGRCVDPQCAKVMCPAGQACQAGACIDLCQGVVCPGGGTCSNGVCSMPVTGSSGSGNGGSSSSTIFGSTGTFGGEPASGPSSGSANGGAGAGGDGTGGSGGKGKASCACSLEETNDSQAAWLVALAGVALLGARRRRRSA